MNIGLVGLGSMGLNLAKNLISKGFIVNAFEKNKRIIDDISLQNISGLKIYNSLNQLCENLSGPKIIMLSLPANKIDECIEELIKYLNPDDIIADLGNSLYLKSIDRHYYLSKHKIDFLGIGVSGGPRGAKFGPAIMVGGTQKAWNKVENIFNSIAAKKDNVTACCYFGSSGSGHLVKLIHNGIEYALMEALAEITNTLMNAFKLNQDDQSKQLNKVISTFSSSFLLEITSKILNAKSDDNQYFINQVDNKIDQNGTGKWTVNTALDFGVSIPSIYAAVSNRSSSINFNYSTKTEQSIENNKIFEINEVNLEEIIFFNFVCSLYQGVSVIFASNQLENFNFNIKEIFKAWSSGCILQGEYLDQVSKEYDLTGNFNLEFLYNLINKKIHNNLLSIRNFISIATKTGNPIPVLSANLSYYDSIFSNHKIGETIQLQRSFFGLHPLKDKRTKKDIKPYWTKL
tara:strand:+ start:3552 stop:4928 length:1377 start_codon:yes stop_codon:yes gene_type:complete